MEADREFSEQELEALKEDTEEELEEEEEDEEVEVEEEEDEIEEEEGKQLIIALEKEEEIENVLESKAKKLNMNRTQVRTLLRQIVGSKEVINHSLEIAGEKDPSSSSASSSIMEPRITRTIAKSVEQVGGKLDWVLETIKSSQTNKSVNEDDTLVLVTQELPDDDKPEDDPEYNPETEGELEGEDDLDDVCNTPSSSIAQTPPCSNKHILDSPCITPSPSLKVNSITPLSAVEEQRRLTRSRASLKEVSIEELEKKFIPPDITSDMYSTEMDEYAMFLQETFGYQEPIPTNSSAVQEEDPDFIYQDVEETADTQYEFKFDRSTKIPRKEVDDLLSELLAEYEDNKDDKEPKEVKVNVVVDTDSPVLEKSGASSSANVEQSNVVIEYSEISDEHIQRIGQQMRQHIQLLLQMALLTSNDSQWKILNRECKSMFQEIMNRSLSKTFSFYAQDNLFPSMSFLQEWEDGGRSPCITQTDTKNKTKFKVSKELFEAVGNSTCFIYPYLLPTSSLRPTNDKSYFSEGEDYLIVYGLDKFKGLSRRESLRLLTSHIMTPKTVDQIRWRIKNKTSKFESNTIKDYVRNGIISVLEDPIIPYKSSKIVEPKKCLTGELPEVWCTALSVAFDPIRASKHPMLVCTQEITSQSKIKPIAKQGLILNEPSRREVSTSENRTPDSYPCLIAPKPPPLPPQLIDAAPQLQVMDFEPVFSTESVTATTNIQTSSNEVITEIRQMTLPVFNTIEVSEDNSAQEAEAGDIFLHVQETLPPETRTLFFEKLVKMTSDKTRAKPVEIFTELHSICEGYCDLQERLLDLLNIQDAMSLGPDIYFQFKVRNSAKKFLKKVSVIYKNDPESMQMIINGIQGIVSTNPDQLNYKEIKSMAQGMFKSDSSLCEEFLSFLPNMILDDQVLNSVESEMDVVSDKGPSEYERISLPKSTEVEQGSDKCICMCHTDEDSEKKVHCVHCSLRFVNGQVYRKDGKITRSLHVGYKVPKDNGNDVPRKKRKNVL